LSGVPAAGTPAVSDASMTQWMEYLYEQQPMPTNAIGVPLTVTVSDSNGNSVATMNAQTDAAGNYMVSWAPKGTGMYKVTASFAGTNSYYSSTSETGIAVGSAAASAAPSQTSPGQVVTPPGSGVSTITYVAIAAVVIIIVMIAAAIVLRKRK